MAWVEFNTEYGICRAEETLEEVGPDCDLVYTHIGSDPLNDFDPAVLSKPFALEVWNYLIDKINQLLVCGQYWHLTPLFSVIDREVNPHVWTIREIHDILYQICPEIMEKYGDKPLMWDKRWLETVIEVIRNGWCQTQRIPSPCPTPSAPPPPPSPCGDPQYPPFWATCFFRVTFTETVSAFLSVCYIQNRQFDFYWSSQTLQSISVGSDSLPAIGVEGCGACPRQELSGTVLVTPKEDWYDPWMLNGCDIGHFRATITITGPGGTRVLEVEQIDNTRGYPLTYPAYSCETWPYAKTGMISLHMSSFSRFRRDNGEPWSPNI